MGKAGNTGPGHPLQASGRVAADWRRGLRGVLVWEWLRACLTRKEGLMAAPTALSGRQGDLEG